MLGIRRAPLEQCYYMHGFIDEISITHLSRERFVCFTCRYYFSLEFEHFERMNLSRFYFISTQFIVQVDFIFGQVPDMLRLVDGAASSRTNTRNNHSSIVI